MSTPASLLWRCRRGTRELDLLLRAYLDGVYAGADDEDRQAFERLVQLDDPELQAMLLDRRHAAGATCPNSLIDKIHAAAADRAGPSSTT